mmetsp:Transcript_34663/g.73056  ORF Transcript_34663/g.73056 Transcript_34663/m.73056 type:complete len:254 (+) Transcript_34663:356-1117(+)
MPKEQLPGASTSTTSSAWRAPSPSSSSPWRSYCIIDDNNIVLKTTTTATRAVVEMATTTTTMYSHRPPWSKSSANPMETRLATCTCRVCTRPGAFRRTILPIRIQTWRRRDRWDQGRDRRTVRMDRGSRWRHFRISWSVHAPEAVDRGTKKHLLLVHPQPTRTRSHRRAHCNNPRHAPIPTHTTRASRTRAHATTTSSIIPRTMRRKDRSRNPCPSATTTRRRRPFLRPEARRGRSTVVHRGQCGASRRRSPR